MRVALLSTMNSIADAGGDRCGFLTVAGRPVIQHQLECALALGCEKIACQAIGLPNELLAVQHSAEKAGVQFQVISGPRILSGMVNATDELLVFADGLLPDQAAAEAVLAGKPAVVVIPADEGVAEGYERIDRDNAWAGLFLVRGPAVERLTELPADADPVAGLLRIALQSGTRIVSLPDQVLANHEWGLVLNEQNARAMETVWLDKHVRPASFVAPSLALADRFATVLMTRWGDARVNSAGILAVAAGLGLIAVLLGWFWQPFVGMWVAAAAYFFGRIGASLGMVERIGRPASEVSARLAVWLLGALDIVLIAVTAMITDGSSQMIGTLSVTALLLALRLGWVLPLRGWKILLADRSLLTMILAVSVYFSQIIVVSQFLVIFCLVAVLLDCRRSKITRI